MTCKYNGCTSLTSITIPNSVTNIKSYAFNGCTSLATVINFSDLDIQQGNLTNGCVAYYATTLITADEQIDDFLFSKIEGVNTLVYYLGDENDREISLPTNSKGGNYIIQSSVFKDCTSLTSVTIPNSVTSIESKAFIGCTNLTKLSIGNFVTNIGDYAFSKCANLTTITIPHSVTSIGRAVFRECKGLEQIILGKNVENIGDNAFKDCSNLGQLISFATNPPVCGKQALTDINKTNCTLHVMKGSIPAYQVADQWNEFFIIEDIPSGIEDVQVVIHNTTTPIYTLQGVQVKEPKENLPAGIYIQDGKKFIVK